MKKLEVKDLKENFFEAIGKEWMLVTAGTKEKFNTMTASWGDPDERAECFHKIADLISKDLPWIPLYNKAGIAGVSDKVQNFVCDYRGITFQIEKWNIAE